MSEAIRLGVAGANGRMGRAVVAVVQGRADVAVAARFDRETTDGLVSRDAALAQSQVVIDFTTGAASAALAATAASLGGVALVIGSTGFAPEEEAVIAEAARTIPIVKAGNYSLGVNMLMGLVRQAAAKLGPEFDIEVFEAHHRRKVDAPSGTALMLGEAAAQGRGVDLAEVAVRTRDGITGAREEGTIGFSVVRGGGIVGEHSVIFAGEEEVLSLSHSARDRSLFARGAVAAAVWVVGKPAGLYDMQDVLGLK